jgi:hypothetical protein
MAKKLDLQNTLQAIFTFASIFLCLYFLMS